MQVWMWQNIPVRPIFYFSLSIHSWQRGSLSNQHLHGSFRKFIIFIHGNIIIMTKCPGWHCDFDMNPEHFIKAYAILAVQEITVHPVSRCLPFPSPTNGMPLIKKAWLVMPGRPFSQSVRMREGERELEIKEKQGLYQNVKTFSLPWAIDGTVLALRWHCIHFALF